MDSKLYKDLVVGRGYNYHYYYSPPALGKPTLLFLHGFPTFSYDWHKQVVFLQPQGYGILVPDLLGAGESAYPLDVQAFRLNGMAQDILDIFAAEGIEKAVGIGHDWGSVLLSRLSLLHPEKFIGFGWIGLCFMEPITVHFDLDAAMVYTKQLLGYEGYSYWEFFLRKDANDIILKNPDSFLQLLYPNDPDAWLDHMVLPGTTSKCIDSDLKLGHPSYMTDEEYAVLRKELVTHGLQSSLNWYHAQVQDVDLEDNLQIPEERWTVRPPSLQIIAVKDCICTPQRARTTMEKWGTVVEYREVPAGHWPHLECAEEVNAALVSWLQGLPIA
ncbi:alpha/beta-hydrolase [Trametes meyenii]|nr:alpha/beta-hydrolase [Trametes meyenii]